jgi:SNF2 family DNA or RNA helicase
MAMTAISLFGFQQEDVDRLAGQRSALISNEMGTGKTYEAIARDQRIRASHPGAALGPTLVVAPMVTVESVWQSHLRELTDLPVFPVDPKARLVTMRHFTRAAERGGAVLIVHWEALRLMPQLTKVRWLHIIADECHKMKNRRAAMTIALKKIPTVWKTAMSGTPAVNRPDELWSVLNWLHPDVYTSYWRFFQRYVATQEEYAGGRTFRKVIGPRNPEGLRKEIAPFSVRRLKADVVPDLPEKYRTEIRVTLTPTQRKAYNTMRDEMVAWIGQQEDADALPAPVVIAQLTRLQQFACAYAEFDKDGRVKLAEPSSKLDACMEVLDEAGEESVVIFSRFKGLIDLLEVRLREAGITYGAFTGATDNTARMKIVRDFQAGELRVFAGTIGAGGVGLTLHRASTVVFLDRDWSPAANGQAEDRLHRIGQRNAVQVIDITARNTIEPSKMRTLETKKAWLKAVLDGGENDD